MTTTATLVPSVESRATVVDVALVCEAAGRVSRRAQGSALWPRGDRQDALHAIDRAIDLLVASRAALLVAERESGTWRGGGDRSFEAWRARDSRLGERTAVAQVRQAEQLAGVPSVVEAVTDGEIPLAHAAVLAKVAGTGTPAQRRAVTSPQARGMLFGLAREQDAGTFATTVARWAATVDPDGLEADHQAQRRERFLQPSDTPRGTLVKGRLDTIAGHRLRLALEAVTPRPAADDDRDPGQRAADALDTMATQILSAGTTKPGAHVPPHVSLIMSEQTWVAARAHRDRQRSAERGLPAPGEGYPPATSEDGTPVPVSEVAVVLCDCAVTRIAVDAAGIPLDLGRTQRLFTGEQRRAVIARDRECVWPTCRAPARWCQIHHLEWWDRDGGATSVDNSAALCSFHHHETHRRDLAITRIGAASREGPPGGGRRRRSAVAPVTYEFRDRTGRLVGEPDAPAVGIRAAPRPQAVGLDLGWTTDPLTGMPVPAFLLSG